MHKFQGILYYRMTNARIPSPLHSLSTARNHLIVALNALCRAWERGEVVTFIRAIIDWWLFWIRFYYWDIITYSWKGIFFIFKIIGFYLVHRFVWIFFVLKEVVDTEFEFYLLKEKIYCELEYLSTRLSFLNGKLIRLFLLRAMLMFEDEYG